MRTFEIGNPNNSKEQIREWEELSERIMKEQMKRFENDNQAYILLNEEFFSRSIKNYTNTKYVYVMLDENTGQYKIGVSKTPHHRERTLQSEKPTIEMLFFYKGGYKEEKELHKKFKEKRTRGEWFKLNEEDLNYIMSYFELKN
jgi:hypothetical protein